jgi:sulfur-oxidizing protein SoxZ
MPHPMETGLRQDESGNFKAPHFITRVLVTVTGRTVFSARMSFAVSQDPLLNFRLPGALAGERLRVTWTDNLGEVRGGEALIT